MTALAATTRLPAHWRLGFAIAVTGHIGLCAFLLTQRGHADPVVPDPVMVVELAGGAQAAAPEAMRVPQEQPPVPNAMPDMVPPRIDIPIIDAPLPTDQVPATIPPVQNRPQTFQQAQRQPTPVNLRAPTASANPAAAPAPGPGSDPESARIEADYKGVVGSYIRRNRFRPSEARRLGISGTTAVYFVVNRRGRISNVTVAGHSGSEVLDREAVEFLRRLSPVPAFPRNLRRDEIPLQISLKFELDRD